MKIRIKVTKEILKRAMYCGTAKDSSFNIGGNCAIALAVRDILPLAHIGYISIRPHGSGTDTYMIPVPPSTKEYIQLFDALASSFEDRANMPEHEFEIELPTGLVDSINIDDIHNSATLEVVS